MNKIIGDMITNANVVKGKTVDVIKYSHNQPSSEICVTGSNIIDGTIVSSN